MKNIIALLFLLTLPVHGQKLVLEQDQRIKEDKFYYEHTDLTYLTETYKISDSWDITPFTGYRLIYENKKGAFKTYSRFHIGAHVKVIGEWGKIVFRNRYEFTPGHELGDLYTTNDNRFRHRIKYYLPVSISKYKITPNISDEFFFDLDHVDYTRNRFAIGLGAQIGRVKPELYYFAEFKKSSDWKRVDVVGLLFKYQF
jgi:hypothetical protein|tara:strand:- start:712 stop:1308 length:597 start_codon:yes stop_codon:yes gene_type:complete